MASTEPLLSEKHIEQLESLPVKKSWAQRTFSPIGAGSVRGSMFSLCSLIIGSGVMGLPLAVYNCGIVLGGFMIIIGGLTCGVFNYILVLASDYTCEYTYVGVTERLYGLGLKRVLEVSSFLYAFGIICAYQAIVAEFLNSFLHSIGIIHDPEFEHSRVLVIVVLNMILIMPLSLFNELKSLRYASTISVIACLYITFVVLAQTPAYIASNASISEEITYFNFSVYTVDALSITIFAYEASRGIPIIYRELRNRSQERMKKVIYRANGLSILMYTSIGVLGYLSYINNMPDLVVFREPLSGGSPSYDWVMVVGRLGVALTLTMGVPLNLNPARLGLTQLISGTNYEENMFRHIVLTLLLLVGSIMVAIVVPKGIVYFKILGGIFSVLTGCVIPCLVYLQISKSLKKKVLLSIWTFIIVLIGLGSVGLTVSNL